MRKRIFQLSVFVVLVCLTAALCAVSASAASASLWFTDPTVTVGSNVSVVVDVKGDDISAYQMRISYDTSYLEYVSSSGDSGNFNCVSSAGLLTVVDNVSTGSTAKMSFTLTFKTKKTGTTKLTPANFVPTSGGGDDITPTAVGDSTITIKPVPEASSDATLKGLTISNGALTPAFSSNVTEYSTSVDFSVTSLTVSAIKNHNGASVYVSGNTNLTEGENAVVVTVTAENGDKKMYTIKVIRGKNPLATGLVVTFADGSTAEISKTITESSVPKGFVAELMTLNGVEINVIKYSEFGKVAAYLIGNDKVAEGYYFIDIATMTAEPFQYLGQASTKLTLLDVKLADAPNGYEVGVFKLGDVEKETLIPTGTETPNHCLIYAIGPSGEKSLYMYDPLENTYQRYGFAELGTEVEEEEETTEAPKETTAPQTEPAVEKETTKDTEAPKEDKSLFSNNVFKVVFIIIAVLIIGLVIVAIYLSTKNN